MKTIVKEGFLAIVVALACLVVTPGFGDQSGGGTAEDWRCNKNGDSGAKKSGNTNGGKKKCNKPEEPPSEPDGRTNGGKKKCNKPEEPEEPEEPPTEPTGTEGETGETTEGDSDGTTEDDSDGGKKCNDDDDPEGTEGGEPEGDEDGDTEGDEGGKTEGETGDGTEGDEDGDTEGDKNCDKDGDTDGGTAPEPEANGGNSGRVGTCGDVEVVLLSGVNRRGCLEHSGATKTRANVIINTSNGKWTCVARGDVTNRSSSTQRYGNVVPLNGVGTTSSYYSVSRDGSACYSATNDD